MAVRYPSSMHSVVESRKREAEKRKKAYKPKPNDKRNKWHVSKKEREEEEAYTALEDKYFEKLLYAIETDNEELYNELKEKALKDLPYSSEDVLWFSLKDANIVSAEHKPSMLAKKLMNEHYNYSIPFKSSQDAVANDDEVNTYLEGYELPHDHTGVANPADYMQKIKFTDSDEDGKPESVEIEKGNAGA